MERNKDKSDERGGEGKYSAICYHTHTDSHTLTHTHTGEGM